MGAAGNGWRSRAARCAVQCDVSLFYSFRPARSHRHSPPLLRQTKADRLLRQEARTHYI